MKSSTIIISVVAIIGIALVYLFVIKPKLKSSGNLSSQSADNINSQSLSSQSSSSQSSNTNNTYTSIFNFLNQFHSIQQGISTVKKKYI